VIGDKILEQATAEGRRLTELEEAEVLDKGRAPPSAALRGAPPRPPCTPAHIALSDAASPLVPGNDDTDMVRASPLTCSGDFLLCLAVCQGKKPDRRGSAS